ncbi:MAG TPA: lysylphosphatidylglycerol synthase transmembrane domain-containing protein [Chloroflexia bacterium]|nr:lysylphosphatidylglycerol synthase transmembrane domain-containing protein [Chloroflexia bacterium]
MRAGTHTTGDGYQKSDSTQQDVEGEPGAEESLQNARFRSSEPQDGDKAYTTTSPRLHDLIDLPEIDVDTGETPISEAEKAAMEAEAPVLSRPVEDIAEDRNWLSHKLLNFRTIISFVLALGILIFIFTRLDINPADTWATMLTANPLMLLLGFVIYYSAFWLRGLRWKQLIQNVGLDKEPDVHLPNVNGLVEIIYLSWFVNCIVPAKLGDAYRSYLLKRNSGVSFSSTIGTILAERVIDLLVLFGLLAASFTLVSNRLASDANSSDFNLGLVMIVGALMVIALIVGLVGLRFFGDLMLRFVPSRFKSKFASFQQGILRSFKRRSLPVLLGYTILIWLCEAGRLFFVTRSLDAHEVTISAVIFIALLSSLLTTLPLTPGGAGLVEGAVVLAMTLFVDNHNLAVSIALLDRLINYWSLIAGGIILYLLSRRK